MGYGLFMSNSISVMDYGLSILISISVMGYGYFSNQKISDYFGVMITVTVMITVRFSSPGVFCIQL